MTSPSHKTLVISALAFAVMWPVVMLVAVGQPPSLVGWLVAVSVFCGVSAAGHAWRRSRSEKNRQ